MNYVRRSPQALNQTMLKVLYASAGGLAALFSNPTWAADGVHFNGTNYMSDLVDTGAPTEAHAGVCSYWYASSQKKQATIVANYPNAILGGSKKGQIGFQIEHYPVGSNMVLHFFVQDPTAQNSMNFYTTTPLHYFTSGAQTGTDDTHVMIYWDSGLQKVNFNINAVPAPVDSSRSLVSGQPFYFTANLQDFTVAAKWVDSPNGLTPTQFYSGDLKQVWCHAGDQDYNILTTPGAFPIGPASLIIVPSTGVYGPVPNPLGPRCNAVFEGTAMGDVPSLLCLAGDHNVFYINGTGGFTVIPAGSLTDAAFDVWDLWKTAVPSGNP